MLPSPSILRKRGCDPKEWKKLFTADPDKKKPVIKKLEELILARISDGRKRNLTEFRVFAAIDMAYDSPFAQTSPTLIQGLLAKNLKAEEVLAELEKWGLKEDELFLKIPIAGGGFKMQLNPPTFNHVVIPLVLAYSNIVWASLYNPRNQNPLFKYEPAEPNDEMRLLCDIITSIIQQIATDFGYAADLRQEILQTILYGICLVFPREVWKVETQLNADEKPELQKEGIRYVAPHPSKMFWDMKFNPCTFNSDTGCEYAGYWKVVSFGEILDNTRYWNRRTVSYGSTNWMGTNLASSLYQEVYPCNIAFPDLVAGAGGNREEAGAFYSSNDRDKAVFQTDFWMKLNPKRWGLGDYNFPIWVRFIVAQDNAILYAEPCCYSPILYYGYDADQLRARNSGFALQAIPYENGVSNALSQVLLTCKQNLANLNFYDKNAISPDDIDKVKNHGETALRGLNMVGFDGRKNAMAGLDVTKAVHSVRFTPQDVTPHFQSINTLLGIMERTLQVSSQEAGAAASHQQSVVEIKAITGSTTNRRALTGTFIDDAIDARKRQLFQASSAYMDDDVVGYVQRDVPQIEEKLKSLGFDVSAQRVSATHENKIRVTGSKKKLRIDGIATANNTPERKNDPQTAQVMMQAIAVIANSQLLGPAIGAANLLKIIQKAAILAGADKDFQLSIDQQQQANQLQQMLQEASQQIMMATTKKVEDDVSKQVAGELAKMQEQISILEQAIHKMLVQSGQAPPPQQPPALNAPIPQPGALGQPAVGEVPNLPPVAAGGVA